jgi:hypothetical protein
VRCLFPPVAVAEKKIQDLPAFIDPTGLYLAKARLEQLSAILVPIVVFEGGDHRAERRVLLSGRLDFTAGPPMAVK